MERQVVDAIINVLSECLGEPKPSLSIDESRGKKNLLYFYELAGRETVLNLLSFLREQYSSDLPEILNGLKTEQYVSGEKLSRKDFYVRMRTLNTEIQLEFCSIEGVRFHRSYGSRLVATVYSGKDTMLELIIDQDRMVYVCSKAGIKPLEFNWWINKCMRHNENLRNIMVKLLRLLGNEHRILLDVARTLANDTFFFPPIAYPDLICCHTPKDIIEKSSGCRLNMNYNKTDINVSYYLNRLADQLDEKGQTFLRNYPREELVTYIQPKDLFEGPAIERFMVEHYLQELPMTEAWEISGLIQGYLHMCTDQQEPIRIYPSFQTFLDKHDELMAAYRKRRIENAPDCVLVPENSQFRELATEMERKDVEWIRTSKRLFQEGEEQHNCVYSYQSDIRQDLCAIFHLGRNGESYTIRVTKLQSGRFCISEMRARFNRPYREVDHEYVSAIIRNYNAYRSIELEDQAMKLQRVFGDKVEIEGFNATL